MDSVTEWSGLGTGSRTMWSMPLGLRYLRSGLTKQGGSVSYIIVSTTTVNVILKKTFKFSGINCLGNTDRLWMTELFA